MHVGGMKSLILISVLWINHLTIVDILTQEHLSSPFELHVEQITSGKRHHFFGYIGQCQTVPWNASGRYILAMEINTIDRMPLAEEAATIVLIDTQNDHAIIPVDETHAWNPQQGTMFYWNPNKPESQFFFNDRNLKTGRVFTVLYDIETRQRVHEYRYEDTPIGNGGVASDGSSFLGLNYGRLSRLRAVTGYPDALDWSASSHSPMKDGIFKVAIESGHKQLLVSYHQLANALKSKEISLENQGLFINHTLWNRSSSRIYFFVRGGWRGDKGNRINMPCSIHADGSHLTLHETHIGGHPEWAEGNLLIGRRNSKQIIYDVDKQELVGQLGNPEIFPDPEGDVSLAPDGKHFVNGYKKDKMNHYVIYRRSDGAYSRSAGFDKGSFAGDIRIDPAPRWNRTSDAILVPGIADNQTRQLFVIKIKAHD
ncbi:MAG: hypothetical protein HN505_02005 [Verrucomicrobia bacterium]|jgi:hypothetical protein|nr:hypothetical protein [Verrucomicrobiota bacterium]MBT4274923.1 hypothetical protein [Verrucomicrobiota bacterium]MBT5062072.1 hypothetical protein [Verrucomicrobiota bacterium]MBT5477832.1 hypothetical protein [Verrucomicrobiota bacterium]MBT6804277.1 hypothetical protein [Verrucomicrobiota bacterium]